MVNVSHGLDEGIHRNSVEHAWLCLWGLEGDQWEQSICLQCGQVSSYQPGTEKDWTVEVSFFVCFSLWHSPCPHWQQKSKPGGLLALYSRFPLGSQSFTLNLAMLNSAMLSMASSMKKESGAVQSPQLHDASPLVRPHSSTHLSVHPSIYPLFIYHLFICLPIYKSVYHIYHVCPSIYHYYFHLSIIIIYVSSTSIIHSFTPIICPSTLLALLS